MGVGAVLYCCVGDSASRIGARGAGNTLRPAFYLPRCHYSTPFERQVQAVFWVLRLGCGWPGNRRPATVGQVGGCRSPGIRRGQRLVPLHAIPRRWAGKPWETGRVGIGSLVCPAGHGIWRPGPVSEGLPAHRRGIAWSVPTFNPALRSQSGTTQGLAVAGHSIIRLGDNHFQSKTRFKARTV